MARFNFTADDVARTRFSPAAAPVVETMLIMTELRGQAAWPSRRGGPRWLAEARAAFPGTSRPLLDLLSPCTPWPDFLDSFAPDLKEGLEEVRATPRAVLRSQLGDDWRHRAGRPPTWVRNLAEGDRESVELVVRALHDLHRAVLEPRWDGAVIAFQAEVARRIPMLAARGHEELFASLHPLLRWRENGLDRTGFDGEYDLHGLGLVLMPSPFWTGDPLFSISEDGRRPHVLVYAAHPRGFHGHLDGHLDGRPRGHLHGRPTVTGALTTVPPGNGDSLAALLGPTRAAALRALAVPRGTAELAGVVGISPGSASDHATVLRDAGLIETSREGRAVRHSLTPLGRTILGQLPAVSDWVDNRSR